MHHHSDDIQMMIVKDWKCQTLKFGCCKEKQRKNSVNQMFWFYNKIKELDEFSMNIKQNKNKNVQSIEEDSPARR